MTPTPRNAARACLPLLLGLLAALGPSSLRGQVPDTVPPPPPPRADTVVVPVPADTLNPADSVPVPDAVQAAEAVDSAAAFHRVPDMEGGAPPGFASGSWVFEREDLLGSRAVTLAELVSTLPGILPLRGGDLGTPRTVTAFGLAGGGVRVFWDGVEIEPLDGGVTDLGRVGLGGVERVRVERGLGEVRIDLTSLRNFDPRPYSLVEAGTGDLSTNVFRGTFVHPDALGGSLGLTLDRLDTRGTDAAETGTQQGTWLRYTWHGGDRWAVTGELRRMKAESEVPIYPVTSTRTDWVVRARGRLLPDLVAEAFTSRAHLEADLDAEGLGLDDVAPIDRARRQHGLHATWTPGVAWMRGAVRLLDGDEVPSTALEAEGGVDLPGIGGASASLSRESWQGEGATLMGARAWTAPFHGVSAFGGWTSGQRGVRIDSVPLPPFPPRVRVPYAARHRLTDRTAWRLGAGWSGLGVTLSGALLGLSTDSLPPLGLPLDRDGLVLPGVERSGWEVAGSLPVPFVSDGFRLNSSLQQWDEGARYLPPRQYQASLDFHDTFLPTENLEVWGAVGVDGRDPMLVPLASGGSGGQDDGEAVPATVPFYQSWYAYVQVRVVTVRIFIRWENASVRDRNQDFPDRRLPRTRALYGVRWTLWN